MIQELIKTKFNVKMSFSSVGRLLKQSGFTNQKPLQRAYQRDKKHVEKWKTEDYPKIKKLAKKENASIFFLDESTIKSDYHSGKTWAPKGQTPVIKTTGARYSLNMISAISPRGHLKFKAINGKMTSILFIDFLKPLVQSTESRYF